MLPGEEGSSGLRWAHKFCGRGDEEAQKARHMRIVLKRLYDGSLYSGSHCKTGLFANLFMLVLVYRPSPTCKS